jgi:Bacterial extracellular solute-binding proteins, family 5 Middle
MAAQLHEWGLQWEFGPYPYASGAYFDPNNVPGYEYPIGYSNQHTVPSIMTGCDLSADGKTVTYHLRPGVTSAAGNEFTADDVIWRFDRERKRPIRGIADGIVLRAGANWILRRALCDGSRGMRWRGFGNVFPGWTTLGRAMLGVMIFRSFW